MVITMKLYIQRDTSQLNSRYLIYDETGSLRYRVTGKSSTSGESMRITDESSAVLCKIRSIGFSALSVYGISCGGETIRLNIAAAEGRASVRFRGISFFIRGDVLQGSYSILDADTAVVCAVGKDFAKQCIQTEIFQEDREIFCLACALCIDSIAVIGAPALQLT